MPLNKKGAYYSWLEGDITSDVYHTEVRLVPICSCGYVFTDGLYIGRVDDDLDIREKYNMIMMPRTTEIHPNVCPKCGRVIEQLTMPDIHQKDEELSPNRYKRVKHF